MFIKDGINKINTTNIKKNFLLKIFFLLLCTGLGLGLKAHAGQISCPQYHDFSGTTKQFFAMYVYGDHLTCGYQKQGLPNEYYVLGKVGDSHTNNLGVVDYITSIMPANVSTFTDGQDNELIRVSKCTVSATDCIASVNYTNNSPAVCPGGTVLEISTLAGGSEFQCVYPDSCANDPNCVPPPPSPGMIPVPPTNTTLYCGVDQNGVQLTPVISDGQAVCAPAGGSNSSQLVTLGPNPSIGYVIAIVPFPAKSGASLDTVWTHSIDPSTGNSRFTCTGSGTKCPINVIRYQSFTIVPSQ